VKNPCPTFVRHRAQTSANFHYPERGNGVTIEMVKATDSTMLLRGLEARVGIEPTHKGFADLSLTTWVPRPG
jgi:hypothetical protein